MKDEERIEWKIIDIFQSYMNMLATLLKLEKIPYTEEIFAIDIKRYADKANCKKYFREYMKNDIRIITSNILSHKLEELIQTKKKEKFKYKYREQQIIYDIYITHNISNCIIQKCNINKIDDLYRYIETFHSSISFELNNESMLEAMLEYICSPKVKRFPTEMMKQQMQWQIEDIESFERNPQYKKFRRVFLNTIKTEKEISKSFRNKIYDMLNDLCDMLKDLFISICILQNPYKKTIISELGLNEQEFGPQALAIKLSKSKNISKF